MAVRRTLRYWAFITLAIYCILLFRHFSDSYNNDYPTRPQSSKLEQTVRFRPSSFDWASVPEHFPAELPLTSLPHGLPKTLPKVQHRFPSRMESRVVQHRRAAVVKAFSKSWTAYKSNAWSWDEVQPVSGRGVNTFGGWAASMVDSLDTLWIMGLYDEFYLAAEAAAQLDWANTTETSANLFETTIRHLGGLLSAYDLSGQEALLQKAKELGDMLYMAFDTPNRMPGFWLNFEDARSGRQIAGTHEPSACPTSLSLEFTRLAQLTGEDKYYDAIDRIRAFMDSIQDKSRLPGMWPREFNFRTGDMSSETTFTIGALADSLYEYLPKAFIITGGLEASYEKMYRKAMDVITQHTLFRPMLPDNDDILFAGTTYIHNGRPDLDPEGQHLSCFAGGMYLLGGKTFGIAEHLQIGERLTRGCIWAYQAFPTGLMPEMFNMIPCPSHHECQWDAERWANEGDHRLPKGFRNARDPKYILRPEAIESVFLLYRVTGDESLRDAAWTMFESITASTETLLAYSAISDVTVQGETQKTDSMESFWMAETLKYFYLIFSPPDVISLDEFVFNTEAHPFRRPR